MGENSREIMIALYQKHNGDWQGIYSDILAGTKLSEDEIALLCDDWRYYDVDEDGGVESVVLLTNSDYVKLVPESGEAFATTAESTGSGCTIKIANKEKADVVVYEDSETHTTLSNDGSLRILKYPSNKETTFSVEVMEIKDKTVETVEVYHYVTLFDSKEFLFRLHS